MDGQNCILTIIWIITCSLQYLLLIIKALSWRHSFVFTVQKSVKVWLVFMAASDISYPSDISRKPHDMFENCTDTWHISEGNALSTLSRGLSSKPIIYGYMQFKTHMVWLSWFEWGKYLLFIQNQIWISYTPTLF